MAMNSHDELDLLSSYLDGELDASDRARLDAHMATCAECRTTLAGLQATIADLQTLPEPVPTPQDTWALRAAIRRARSPMRRWQRVAWASGAVAAAAIVFAAVTLPGNGTDGIEATALSGRSENAGVALFESGENLTAADAQARLLTIAGVKTTLDATIPTPTATPQFSGGGSSGAGTVPGGAPVSGPVAPAEAYMRSAESDQSGSFRTDIDRCVGVVRSSTQDFLEPLQFVVATFESKPAFLLFFRSAERYELWVVDRTPDCGVLFFSQAGGS